MSEWAPLCIGPYAQSNKIHNFLVLTAGQSIFPPTIFPPSTHICFYLGQIPLDPTKMVLLHPPSGHLNEEIPSTELMEDIKLSLRHVQRVLNVNQSSLRQTFLGIVYINKQRIFSYSSKQVEELFWKSYHELVLESSQEKEPRTQENENYEEDQEDEYELEEADSDENSGHLFPLVVVPVSGLPRDASVEIECCNYAKPLLPLTKWVFEKNHCPAITKNVVSPYSTDERNIISYLTRNNQDNKTRKDSGDCYYSLSYSCLHFPRNFVSGEISLIYKANSDSGTSLSPAMETYELVASLVEQFRQSLLASKLNLDSITFAITVFVLREVFPDIRELEMIIRQDLTRPGLKNNFSLNIFPVEKLVEEDKEWKLMQFVYYSMDFTQIETNHWINSQ
jgi:enamine deaminase RidA (YjgF/YER057c/UK114 family)